MKLSEKEILDKVNTHEYERADYLLRCQNWERMWKLDPGFGRDANVAVEAGQEQVILPQPFNILNVAERLLASWPEIQYKVQDVGNAECEKDAVTVEKFLLAYWRQAGNHQTRNVLVDARKYLLMFGRAAVEVKWIKDVLPDSMAKRRAPILTRALDPRNVGIKEGSIDTEWVYHRYESTVLDVMRRWPASKNRDNGGTWGQIMADYEKNPSEVENTKVIVIDFWYRNFKTGKVWNTVLVEDEYAKVPYATDYPELPIVVARGDYMPGVGDQYDGLSLLHPLSGLWEYMCRLASQMATGVLWHFWPAVLLSNEFAEVPEGIKVGPGITTPVAPGTHYEMVKIEPNVPIAQQMYDRIDAQIQQSGFPEVMFGKAPGDLQSGFGVSMLSDAARGRIGNFLMGLELLIARVNTRILATIETFAGEEGVTVWGVDTRDTKKYVLSLSKAQIKGNYDNEVSFAPQIPQDLMQKATLGLQMTGAHQLTTQTFHDKLLPGIAIPTDEQSRLDIQELMQSDEMRPYRLRKAAQKLMPVGWEQLLVGTPFMPPPPAGFHWMPDNTLMADSAMSAPGAAPSGPLMPSGPGSPPMGPMSGPPPIGPGGPPTPMSPPPAGPPMPIGPESSMPEQMPMNPAMMQGGPQGIPPGVPLQPPPMMGPQGNMPLPPAAGPQLTPADLGLPAQGAEQIFQQLVGQGMSPQQIMQILQNIPPQER